MNNNLDISIVIPVFNSQDTLSSLIERIKNTLQSIATFELILVDDGSSDESWITISKLKTTNPEIKGIKLSRNYGQHNALICGFASAIGNYIITMDDDLQHPPEEIIKLINTQKETNADLVYGLPIDRKHSSVKKAGSYFVRKSSKYFADNPNGEGSSFRMIDSKTIKSIVVNHSNNYVFIDEIVHWYTSKIALVDVKHDVRKHGKTGYSFLKLTKLYLDVFINYSANPLRIMIYGGLLSSIITFGFGLKFIIKKVSTGAPLGYTSLIVSILFSTSIIMLCIGIIGKYIFNLYNQQKNKPLYRIDQTI